MNKFSIKYFLLCFCLFACGQNNTSDVKEPVNNTADNQRLMQGEEMFMQNCITCHTLRYIEIQPEFPRKTWQKITDKMIKSFGAPIPDSTETLIVDYLMSIKGAKE